MDIGADDGCHEVPDPIASIDIKFFSLEPIRMPISSPFITSGPLFMLPPICVPGIWFGPGDAAGTGMFIFICGEGDALGDASGICMPGMFCSLRGVGDDDGDGVGKGIDIGCGCCARAPEAPSNTKVSTNCIRLSVI